MHRLLIHAAFTALGLSFASTPAFAAPAKPVVRLAPISIRGMTPQAAIDAAKAQVAAAPDSANAQFELAMAYARTPFLDAGWQALERVQAIDEDYAARASERYAALVVENPDDVEAHFRLACARYLLGDPGAAREQLERVVALAPEDPWGYDYLGFVLAELNHVDEAATRWQRALEIEPNNPLTHFFLGQISYREGHFPQAAASVSKALELRRTSLLHP